MPKHYIYRMDHDLGFAPNVDYGICTLCGCKKSSVEKWAKKDNWVIGLGGNGTGKANKLIYAMHVEEVIPYAEFKARYKRKSAYLSKARDEPAAGANVLISRRFYYLGHKAVDLPNELQHIIIRGRGCKLVSDEDTAKLSKHLAERYSYGKHGRPNNVGPQENCGC